MARPLPSVLSRPRYWATCSVCGTSLSVMLSSIERSEEHTSELQSRFDLVCRLLLENKNVRPDLRPYPVRLYHLVGAVTQSRIHSRPLYLFEFILLVDAYPRPIHSFSASLVHQATAH